MQIGSKSVIGSGETRSFPTRIFAVATPSAPTLSVTDTTRDSCSVAWSDVTPPATSLITGYVVLIDDGKSRSFRVGYDGRNDPSNFEATIFGLTQMTSYRLVAFAVNKAGDGANSTEVICHTAQTPGVPGTPTWVSSTSSTLELEWAPAYDDGGSPIMNYEIWIDKVEGDALANQESWQLAFQGSSLTSTLTNLDPTFAYRVKARAVSE